MHRTQAEKAAQLTGPNPAAYSHEAEATFLGSAIFNLDNARAGMRLVSPEHFGRPAHRIIWQAMLRLLADPGLQDAEDAEIHIAFDLRKRGLLEQVGGLVEIAEIMDWGLVSPKMDYLASYIISAWQNRQLTAAVDDVKEAKDPDAKARALQGRIADILAATPSQRTQGAADLNADFNRWLEQPAEQRSLVRTYTSLDKNIGDLMPGYVTGVAARASAGKTTFLMQTALRNSLCGVPTLVLSLEMEPRQLWGRLHCHLAAVDSRELLRYRGERLAPEQWDAVSRAQAVLQDAPLFIPEVRRGATVDAIWRQVDTHVREHGVRFVAVDHLRLIHGEGKGETERQTDRISRLCDLAAEVHLPILCAMQINREGGKAERPALHHLEGSGAIEQDCETIIILHAEPPDSGADRSTVEAVVAKARDGKPGAQRLDWQPQFYRIDYDYFANMQASLPYRE